MRAVAEQGALRGFGWTVSVVHVAVSGTGLQCSGNPMAGRGASVTMELLPTGGSTMAMSTGDDPDRTELLATRGPVAGDAGRSEEHTSELQSLMRISYAVFCFKKKKHK